MLKKFIEPLHSLKWQHYLLLVGIQLAIVLGAWELRGHGLIPGPSRIFSSFFHLLGTQAFYENLMASLSLTARGMFISIIFALIISYLAFIPFFKPVADFIMKCRYLTLTGLIFLFTLITQSGGQLKLSLLIFGIVPFFVTSMLSILKSIYKEEFDLCRTLRMSRWRSWWEVTIVGRLDQVFEVMRQNFAIAWLMITMVEGLSMSEGGLGTMMIKSNKYIDLGTVFSILLVILIFGVAFDYLLAFSRCWIFPYSRFQVEEQ